MLTCTHCGDAFRRDALTTEGMCSACCTKRRQRNDYCKSLTSKQASNPFITKSFSSYEPDLSGLDALVAEAIAEEGIDNV